MALRYFVERLGDSLQRHRDINPLPVIQPEAEGGGGAAAQHVQNILVQGQVRHAAVIVAIPHSKVQGRVVVYGQHAAGGQQYAKGQDEHAVRALRFRGEADGQLRETLAGFLHGQALESFAAAALGAGLFALWRLVTAHEPRLIAVFLCDAYALCFRVGGQSPKAAARRQNNQTKKNVYFEVFHTNKAYR